MPARRGSKPGHGSRIGNAESAARRCLVGGLPSTSRLRRYRRANVAVTAALLLMVMLQLPRPMQALHPVNTAPPVGNAVRVTTVGLA